MENDPVRSEELAAVFADLEVTTTKSNEKALALVRRFEPEVVLFGLGDSGNLDEAQNLGLLRQILSIAPAIKLIAVTGENSRDLAVKAVGLGATDFYHLPVNAAVLSIVVRRALRIQELEAENAKLRENKDAMTLDGIVGTSDAMRQLCRTIGKIAPTNATVLVLGESGTGKELVAQALHRLSGRAHEPFVAINCAAIPDNLLESELFGYEKGAFTGATRRTLGKLELAGRGTVFLDEMGEMPASLQAKLLRVVQERSVERIGGRTPVPLESRLICATNRDLGALIANGRFRDDLFYRISEVTVRIPALRERQGDSVLLAQWLLQQMAGRFARPVRAFAPDALRAVQSYSWPGNVREMENRIKSAVIMAEHSILTCADLGLHDPDTEPEYLNLRLARQKAETQAARQALAVAGGNLSRAAQLLGVTRPTLYDLLEKHHIDATQFAPLGPRLDQNSA